MTQRMGSNRQRLALTESDLGKLRSMVETAKRYLVNRSYIEELDEKLEQAEVISPDELPSDQVEMEASIRVTDLDRSEQKVYKLVFPREANYGDCISVIAPLGSALLGSRVGDIVEVHAPTRTRKIRVDDIVTSGEQPAA